MGTHRGRRWGVACDAYPGVPDRGGLIANRRFPAGNFIRSREQFDYIQEPDVFHDFFGHVPLLVGLAPSWGWIVVANVLLGINQGLTWSTTVIMKIDLVGPARRGFAMGLNEAAGYGAVAVSALATGYVAASYGLRPEPFYLGVAYVALGLALSHPYDLVTVYAVLIGFAVLVALFVR